MLREELIDGGKFVRHYSDTKMMIKQDETGCLYDEAVDLVPCRYTYTETDEPIPEPEPEPEAEKEA